MAKRWRLEEYDRMCAESDRRMAGFIDIGVEDAEECFTLFCATPTTGWKPKVLVGGKGASDDRPLKFRLRRA
jgi:hypothetical protein